MAEYKPPKTRIRVVEDGNGVRYYPQYLLVIIPFILWGWDPVKGGLEGKNHLPTLDEAKWRIDGFLTRHKHSWVSDIERKARKKVKKKVSVIDYP